MKIAIFGSGGVGGYFGARLQQHRETTGCDVTFIARGQHLQAMRERGLQVFSPAGDVHLPEVTVTDNTAEVGPVDVVLVAVKAWQLENSCAAIDPLLGKDTAVVPLLNGVDAPEILSSGLAASAATSAGTSAVLAGLCGIVAYLDGPGCIRHVGIEPFITFGELDNHRSERVVRFSEALLQSGIKATLPDDILQALWRKFIFIAPLSGVGSVTRATLGVMRETPELRQLIVKAIGETIAVGQALGVNLLESDVNKTLELLDASPPDGTTSMQRDIAAARRSELDFQTGAVVRLGRHCDVSTPINELLYHCLMPQEALARKAAEKA